MDRLEMLSAREQLMEDIDCIIESNYCFYVDGEEEHHTIDVSPEDLILMLCDAVCRNFPTK